MSQVDNEQFSNGFGTDRLRLEEHAKLLSSVSTFIDALEGRGLEIESQDTINFDVANDGTTAIPRRVTDLIGPVQTIDVHLSLNHELLKDDSPIDEPDHEPSDETFIDKISGHIVGDQEPTDFTPVANISLYLNSDSGVFVISRSSLKSVTPADDAAFVNGKAADEIRVPQIPQDEVNDLILSLLEPTPLEQRTHATSIDYLKPEAFGVLQELFQAASFNNHNALGYAFHDDVTLFRYSRQYDEIEQHFKTSFDIRFTTTGEEPRTIFARNSMDTEFTTSFETLATTYPTLHPEGYTRIIPYSPTLDELAQLTAAIEYEIEHIDDLQSENADMQPALEETLFTDDEMEIADERIGEALEARSAELDYKIGQAVRRLTEED